MTFIKKRLFYLLLTIFCLPPIDGFAQIYLYGVDDGYYYEYGNYDLSSIIKQLKGEKRPCNTALSTRFDSELGFSKDVSLFLERTIDSIRIKMDSTEPQCKRFIITGKLDTLKLEKSFNKTILFEGNLKLYILDIVTKNIFNQYTFFAHGEGDDSDEAIMASLYGIAGISKDLFSFIKDGIDNIEKHYEGLLSQNISNLTAKYLPRIGYEGNDRDYETMEAHFDNLVKYLLSTPNDNKVYETALEYAAFFSYIKSEYHHRYILKKASKLVGWTTDEKQTKANNKKAIALLKDIPKESSFYNEATILTAQAKEELMTEEERLNRVTEALVNDHTAQLERYGYGTKDKTTAKKQIGLNTSSGIFTLGVLLLAASIAVPASAPVARMIIILL